MVLVPLERAHGSSVSAVKPHLIIWYRFVSEYTKAIAPHIKIIASAGTADKVKIVKGAGVDVAFNYKEEDTFAVLKEHGPIDMCVRMKDLYKCHN